MAPMNASTGYRLILGSNSSPAVRNASMRQIWTATRSKLAHKPPARSILLEAVCALQMVSTDRRSGRCLAGKVRDEKRIFMSRCTVVGLPLNPVHVIFAATGEPIDAFGGSDSPQW